MTSDDQSLTVVRVRPVRRATSARLIGAVVIERAQDEAAIEPTRLLVGGLARQRHSPSPSSDTPAAGPGPRTARALADFAK